MATRKEFEMEIWSTHFRTAVKQLTRELDLWASESSTPRYQETVQVEKLVNLAYLVATEATKLEMKRYEDLIGEPTEKPF